MSIDNNWRLIYPVGSSNYVLNPSAETSDLFGNIGGAVTRVTTYAKYGLYSYLVQPTAINDGIRLNLSTLTNAEHFVTFRVRDASKFNVTIGSATKPAQFIEKIDNNWNLYGVPFSASEANGQTILDVLAQEIRDFYIDGIQCEPLAQWTTYIDGTQPGCEWLGAQHASISQRSSQSRAGGYPYDFYKQYGFFVEKIVGAGASAKNVNIDSYSILPGGQLNNVKTESRDFTIIGKFFGDDELEIHDNRQALIEAFANDAFPANQPVLLRFNGARVQKETGTVYGGGLEGEFNAVYAKHFQPVDEEWNRLYKFTERATIALSCPDPYWYEVGESAIALDTSDSATFRSIRARLRSTGQWDVLGPPGAGGTYNNGVDTITEDETYVYVGSNFLNWDGIANADGIVRWHKVNQSWSAMSTGTTSNVADIKVGPNGYVYACGAFTTIGGVAANRIAYWDGAAWNALGSGFDSTAAEMAFAPNGNLYVTGAFTTAGGGAANYIAVWNGSTWAALGSGLGSSANSLVISNDGIVYVTGGFTTAGGSSANRIAAWDIANSTWSALGSGLGGTGIDLAIGEDNILYVTGSFTTAGGITANRIAAWNGTSWSTLGSGLSDQGNSLSIGPDGILYVSGLFLIAGGISLTSDSIARWNGYAWSRLDFKASGAGSLVREIYASQYTDPVINQKYNIFVHHVSSGTSYYDGLVTANNEGNVPVYPKIVYTRSGGTQAILYDVKNERTAKELLFDYSLIDGETLTIDLNPLDKTIISSFFGSRIDALLANSDFGTWSLLAGNNDVTTFINDTGTPTLTAYMLWRDAYDGYN